MPEESELNYRKLIESEIEDLGIQGDSKTKLLAESDHILKLAHKSKDHIDFLGHLAKGEKEPIAMADFRYGHVVDYLIKRARAKKKLVMAEVRSRVSSAIDETAVETIEQLNIPHGSMMAIQAEAVKGKPVFAVKEISTEVATHDGEVKPWVTEKVKNKLFGIVFLFKRGKWELVGLDSDLEPLKEPVEAFFSQALLTGLFIVHRPKADNDQTPFKTLKKKGLN